MRAADDLVGIMVPAETLARALRRNAKYRVQTMVEKMDRREFRIDRSDHVSVGVVDVETTGLDRAKDRIIELAVQHVEIDGHGRIVTTGRAEGWFEDPGFPIPPEIVKKTGITDEMVRGRSIHEGPAFSALSSVDILLSHNAAFDRQFIERRFDLAPKPWICSLHDIDWEEFGFSGRKLEDLLRRCDLFFEGAHRATEDVNALLHLLDHVLDNGRSVMKELYVNAAKPSWLVEVRHSPYDARFALRGRKYTWESGAKTWWRHVPDAKLAEEQHWLVEEVYRGARAPEVRRVTWKERYSAAFIPGG